MLAAVSIVFLLGTVHYRRMWEREQSAASEAATCRVERDLAKLELEAAAHQVQGMRAEMERQAAEIDRLRGQDQAR